MLPRKFCQSTRTHCQLSIHWSLDQFQKYATYAVLCSTIVEASSVEQLKENLSCVDIELSTEILAEIDRIHARYPNPTPSL